MSDSNHTFDRIHQALNAFSKGTGALISWLTLAMMLLTALIVFLRYGLNIGSIALQESVSYLHATVFLLAAAYTFADDEHVRVDIFYRNFSAHRQAWVNAVGGIVFLLPVSLFLLGITWRFAADSWAIGEASGDAGGIDAVYILKSLLPLASFTLALQGLADVIRNGLLLSRPPAARPSSSD